MNFSEENKYFLFRSILNQAGQAAQNYGAPSSPQSTLAPQSGRGASVVSFSYDSNHLTKLTPQKRNILVFFCVKFEVKRFVSNSQLMKNVFPASFGLYFLVLFWLKFYFCLYFSLFLLLTKSVFN